MTVACSKWKVTLLNIAIRDGALCDNNLQLKSYQLLSRRFLISVIWWWNDELMRQKCESFSEFKWKALFANNQGEDSPKTFPEYAGGFK